VALHTTGRGEVVGVQAHLDTHLQYSFIATLAEWNEWRRQHGQIIERQISRRHGSGEALLLPFEATGEVFEELFD
jgi:hypothetical protein